MFKCAHTYDRNDLTTGRSTASYNYDPFGRLNTLQSGGEIVEQYVYDGFDRTTTHKKMDSGGALVSTTYQYDPLDRTQSKTEVIPLPLTVIRMFTGDGKDDDVESAKVHPGVSG